MTGLELLKAPEATAGEIADIISQPCPPVIPETCDRLSCRECWLTWLVTGGTASEPCEGIASTRRGEEKGAPEDLSLIHISEPTRH